MDIVKSLKLWRFWIYRSHIMFSLKYRDSRLGLLWPMLSLLAATFILGMVWGILLNKQDRFEYFLYLFSGYPVWTIISGAVGKGCLPHNKVTFAGIPFFTIIFERVMSVHFTFLYTLPVILLVSVSFNGLTASHLIFLPYTVILMTLWAIGLITLCVSVVSIFPDIKHLIEAVMRLAFLATPILWEVSRLGVYEKYIWLNPFYIPLESMRRSLSGIQDGNTVYLSFLIYALGLLAVGMSSIKLREKSLLN